MIIFSDNILKNDGAIITASSEFSSRPLSNLLIDRLTETTKIGAGLQYIQVSLPVAVSVDYIALAGASFSNATIQLSNDGFSSVDEEFAVTDETQNSEKLKRKLLGYFNPINAKDIRLVVDGTSAKTIGSLSIGKSYLLPGMDMSQKINLSTTRKKTRSQSGQKYKSEGYEHYGYEVSFPYLTVSESIVLRNFWEKHLNQESFFSIVWNDLKEVMPMLYGSIEQEAFTLERSDSKIMPFKAKFIIGEDL